MNSDSSTSEEKDGSRIYAPDASNRKQTADGILLVPQPSEDPNDPLNWSMAKKCTVTALFCAGAFVSTASGLGNALGYFVQLKVYNKDNPIDISYSVVAATAGIAVGPLVAVPLGRRFSRSIVFFWSMVGLLVTGIWSATMTHEDQYNAFVVARLFGGFFGGNAAALGADTVVDLFFLHQRGKALTVLNLSFLFGVVIGPTFSGFISGGHASWTVQFWWSNGLEAAIILASLVFLEDTYYDRTPEGAAHRKPLPSSYVARRVRTLFCGSRNGPTLPASEFMWAFVTPFLVGLSPATILCGGLTLIDFGFAAFFNIILTVFIQEPEKMGGYGFTPTRNAEFLFSLWFGVIAAQIYGYFANDRLPLWICRRRGGIWQPEYRLYTLWLPGFILLPIALGLYGAALQYHLHYMVLALSCFLGGFATNSLIPVTVNYVIECFKEHASESAAIMGVYRLAFSLTIPFFAPAWIKKVGFGWCLGMAAFFSIFAFFGIILLMWKGEAIRRLSFPQVSAHDGGKRIVESNNSDPEEVEK